jgi:predicted ATP-dependent endonuclease of OLD family
LGKFEPKEGAEIVTMEIIRFKQNEFPDYTVLEKKVVKIGKNEVNSAPLNLNDFFSEYLYDTFWNYSHVITFWKSSPQYLIIDEIDLANFALDPKKISIPLRNCFILSGKKKIDKEIAKLKTPVSIQNLEELLSYKVTSHINKVWPEHPVKIKFKINNGKLTFLVEDKGVRFQNKTTNQRSDGFRQLVSFLLTLSAENESEELSNTILLLDEPETHLHPTAQLNLKDELIKISQNDKNNLVFFATHSNYLIDKKNIERCYKVYKEKNHKTKIERLKPHHSSFSEVNYEVFDISTNDYHTELFGYLEDMEKAKLNALPKTKKWNNQKLGIIEDVSLPRYIRHSIHHPENTKNQKFTDQELKESIDIMRKLKYG